MADLDITNSTPTNRKITIHPVDGITVNPDINLLPLTTVDQIKIVDDDGQFKTAPIILSNLTINGISEPLEPISCKGISILEQENMMLYLYNKNDNAPHTVSVNNLDYSKMTVINKDEQDTQNIRVNDFVFKEK